MTRHCGRLVLMVFCCGASGIDTGLSGQVPADSAVSDSAVFSAVVRGIAAVEVWGEFKVTLKPIPSADTAALEVDPSGAIAGDSILAARVSVLAHLGIKVADSLDFGGCPGIFVADSTNANCPPTESTLVGIGLPRIIRDASAADHLDSPGNDCAPADVVVGLQFIYLSPHGSSGKTADYFLAKSLNGWYVVGKVTRIVSH